jgi:DNA-binding transcriptional ArsR family regulator
MESAVLAALASPRRQEILRLIWRDELAAGAIAAAMPDVTFGAVSLQLRTLQHAGLVVCRRDQQNRFYRANREALGPIAASLERMWTSALWRLKILVELEASRRGPARGCKPARGRRARRTRRRQPGAANSAAHSWVKRDREH